MCREGGIQVHYCAEQFENDGSLTSNMLKAVKRVMAGEHSRELSVKVFAGQCLLIGLRFRQGGPAGYGLRRVLVDEGGTPKTMLERGEHKSLQIDRVILQPGPLPEIEMPIRLDYLSALLAEKGALRGFLTGQLCRFSWRPMPKTQKAEPTVQPSNI